MALGGSSVFRKLQFERCCDVGTEVRPIGRMNLPHNAGHNVRFDADIQPANARDSISQVASQGVGEANRCLLLLVAPGALDNVIARLLAQSSGPDFTVELPRLSCSATVLFANTQSSNRSTDVEEDARLVWVIPAGRRDGYRQLSRGRPALNGRKPYSASRRGKRVRSSRKSIIRSRVRSRCYAICIGEHG